MYSLVYSTIVLRIGVVIEEIPLYVKLMELYAWSHKTAQSKTPKTQKTSQAYIEILEIGEKM